VELRPRPTSVRIGSVALGAALLVLGGCGEVSDEPPVEASEQPPVEASEEPPEEASESDPPDVEVTPRPGMVDPQPVEIWTEWGSYEGDLKYINFLSRGAPCEVLDSIDIEEDEATGRVTVTLYQGRDPDLDPDAPCDGPLEAFRVVLPPLTVETSPEEGMFVNGADLLD
jgi:hypothetical protein